MRSARQYVDAASGCKYSRNTAQRVGTARADHTASGGGVMRNFLAAVLSVIAVGVLLIAYGLLSPRVAASDVYPSARPVLAGQQLGDIEDLTPRHAAAYRVNDL